MKPQDVGFFILLVVLLLFRRPIVLVWAGLLCLITSMPLFATWTFFTAERLTWYGTAYFLTFILISLLWPRKVE